MLTVDFKRLNLQPGDQILDVGCGSGRHACEAIRYEAVTVVGVDRDVAEIHKARANLALTREMVPCGGAWETAAADITCLPFRDNRFDVVICCETLEHIPRDDQAVAELARVLKPGRPLVVSVPRRWPEQICWGLSREYYRANGGHIRIYARRKLQQLFETAGFICRGRHHAHGLHVPYWWLKCAVGPTREACGPVMLYHRLLVWDMMARPRLTRILERILNPLMGKSLVLYMQNGKNG